VLIAVFSAEVATRPDTALEIAVFSWAVVE